MKTVVYFTFCTLQVYTRSILCIGEMLARARLSIFTHTPSYIHTITHTSSPSQLQERSSESEEEEVEDDSGEEESDMEVFESLPLNSHFSNLDAGWLTTA